MTGRYSAQKATAFAVRGPAGWWRIAKNLTRYGLGVGHEHPAPPQFWELALRDAGFTDVRFEPIVAEAGIVSGTRPGNRQARGGTPAIGLWTRAAATGNRFVRRLLPSGLMTSAS